MDRFFIKIFATALAFSQVTTRPDGVKTEFDAVRDRFEVAQLLSAGCAHMRKAFDIEDINLDDLIATAMDDKEALSSEIKALKGLIWPTSTWPTGSSAKSKKWKDLRSILVRSSLSTTARSRICPTPCSLSTSGFLAPA